MINGGNTIGNTLEMTFRWLKKANGGSQDANC